MWVYLLVSALSFNVGACYLHQPSIYYQQPLPLYYPAPAYRPNYNYGCLHPRIIYNQYYTHQFPYWSSYDQRYTYPYAFYIRVHDSFPISKRPTLHPLLISTTSRPVLTSTTSRSVLTTTTSRPVLTSTTSRPVLTSTTSRPVFLSTILQPVSTTTYTTLPTPRSTSSPTFIPTSIPTSSYRPEQVTTEKEDDHDNGSGGFPMDDEDFVFPQ